MEGFPGSPNDLDGWLVSWSKRMGRWTMRAAEIVVGTIGAVTMLVVIGILALFDYVFD